MDFSKYNIPSSTAQIGSPPSKPRLGASPTPQDYRKHADDLEEYEIQMKKYKERERNYLIARKNKREVFFLDVEYDLRPAHFTDEQWKKAWDWDGDILSEGFEQAYHKLSEIVEKLNEFLHAA